MEEKERRLVGREKGKKGSMALDGMVMHHGCGW